MQSQWTWGFVERLLQDLRWTSRSLRRAPAFTLATVATLAIAISSASAVISLAVGTLFRPLPYRSDSRIVSLASGGRTFFTGGAYQRLKDGLSLLDAVAVDSGSRDYNLLLGPRAHHVVGRLVSPEWFAVLGTPAFRGRTLQTDVDRHADPVLVLSHRLWIQRFAADPAVIGTSVTLDGRAHEVVGVMPASFVSFPDADMFIPADPSSQDGGRNHIVLARLKAGVEVPQAQAELVSLAQRLSTELGWSAVAARNVRWVRYRDALGLVYRPVMVLISAAVVVLLLIATVNVAALQLVRVTARAPELATRAALGGSPTRMLREALTEALAIGGLGGLVGLMAFVVVRPHLAERLQPEWGASLPLDYRVLAAVAATMALVAIAIGVLPAIRAREVNFGAIGTLSGRTSASRSTLRWRRGFAAAQVALRFCC